MKRPASDGEEVGFGELGAVSPTGDDPIANAPICNDTAGVHRQMRP